MRTGNAEQSVAAALERERLVASIAREVRSDVELERVLQTVVRETGAMLGAARCLVRLEGPGEEAPECAEWRADGIPPAGPASGRLPGANLAVRERRTVAIADVEDAPELEDESLGGRDTLLALGTRAVLATPIEVLGETIGVLVLHRAELWRWSQEEIDLVETVAREAGLAAHLARLLRENQRRLQQASALFETAQALTSDLRVETVLERLVLEVSRLLEADAAGCFLYDARRETLRCAAVHGLDRRLLQLEAPAGGGLAGEALRHGRSVLARGPGLALTDTAPDAYAELSAAAAAPLRSAGEVHGVLCVGTRDRGRVFDRGDGEVLQALAGLAAAVLKNATSFEQNARQARLQRRFHGIAAVLGGPLSLTETIEAVALAGKEALGGSAACVLMPGASGLVLVASLDLPPALASALASGLPAGAAALASTAAEGRVLAAPAVATDERFELEWRSMAGQAGVAGLLGIPVSDLASDESGLVLVLFDEARVFDDDDLELAHQLARAAEDALRRSELFEAERSSRALAQQLARTGSLLATELDPRAVLDEVVTRAPELLDVEACAIRVLEGAELVVRAAFGEGVERSLASRAPASGRLSGDVVQSRAPVAVEAVGGDQRLLAADPILSAGYEAYLGVPLARPEGGPHGVLSVYAGRPRLWREDEIDALLALAANASSALSNAELYQRVALEKERSEAILANIADGIVATDRDGEVLLWNEAAAEITGVPAAEAVGRTPAQVLGRALEAEGSLPAGNRTISLARGGGEEMWLSLTEAVMRDPAGELAGRIFAFRDISDERQVEQMKSDFVSAVSHELRTPLTSIYGFAATLLRSDLEFSDEERETFLTYIASETERLTRLVDSLLNVARLDRGELQLQLDVTDVGSVVSDVVGQAQRVRRNGQRFVLDLPAEPLTVRADRERLSQILQNLVENAVKFSPRGGTVTVGARQRGSTVELRVADEGLGIAQGEQSRIFAKFYRAPPPGGGNEGGSGLGLFIARGLVLAMGGRMSVSSTEGKGSTFLFELPVA